jgi:hypothetical protein
MLYGGRLGNHGGGVEGRKEPLRRSLRFVLAIHKNSSIALGNRKELQSLKSRRHLCLSCWIYLGIKQINLCFVTPTKD